MSLFWSLSYQFIYILSFLYVFVLIVVLSIYIYLVLSAFACDFQYVDLSWSCLHLCLSFFCFVLSLFCLFFWSYQFIYILSFLSVFACLTLLFFSCVTFLIVFFFFLFQAFWRTLSRVRCAWPWATSPCSCALPRRSGRWSRPTSWHRSSRARRQRPREWWRKRWQRSWCKEDWKTSPNTISR